MTDHQYELAQALARCTFTPGSTEKRFVRWASAQPVARRLSERASAFLERLAHSYRRQIGRCMAESCAICGRACPACGAKRGQACNLKGREAKPLLSRDKKLVHAARLEERTIT